MPSPNNMRIMTNINLQTSVTASSTASGYSVTNMLSNPKGLTWRSTTTQAALIVDLGSITTVGGVVAAFSNFSSSATIRVLGFTSAPAFNGNLINSTPSPIYNSGTINCCPWNTISYPNISTTMSNVYSFGGGTYSRVWTPTINSTATVRYLGIEINDPGNQFGYLEIGRLCVGPYWSPVHNPGYGMEAGVVDNTELYRTENGDLLGVLRPRWRTLKFDLQWINHRDRKALKDIMQNARGSSTPVFVSLFPDSTGADEDFQREDSHQILGRWVTLPGVSYTSPEIYSASFEIEEM